MSKIVIKTLGFALLFSIIAMLPFIHDVIINKAFVTRAWVPNFGIEAWLYDSETQLVHGYSSYKTLVYFVLLHVFATIGWMGWAVDAKKGKPYRFFLLVPACMTFYTTLIILLDFRRTSYNEVNTKIIFIIVVNFLLMVFYLYRYFKNKKN